MANHHEISEAVNKATPVDTLSEKLSNHAFQLQKNDPEHPIVHKSNEPSTHSADKVLPKLEISGAHVEYNLVEKHAAKDSGQKELDKLSTAQTKQAEKIEQDIKSGNMHALKEDLLPFHNKDREFYPLTGKIQEDLAKHGIDTGFSAGGSTDLKTGKQTSDVGITVFKHGQAPVHADSQAHEAVNMANKH